MPEFVRRVTLRDVASAAGCHFSTVSLALRNHPRLPQATRDRVRAAARKLGYVADPALAALAHYRTGRREVSFRSTLAWITNFPTRHGWRKPEVFHQFYLGAEARASALGYKLEIFWLREAGMTGARASQILRARNVAGLLVAPQPVPGGALELDWPQFSSVSIGYSLASPALHVVCPHQYRAMKLAMRRLVELGYQRIGLVVLDIHDERADLNWTAGYLAMQQAVPARRRLPPFTPPRWDESRFAEWFRACRPDAIVTKSIEGLAALRRLGCQVPRDVGVACITFPHPGGELSGVDENANETGAAAVDFLAGMIYRNERGVPANPQRLLIEGTWIEGTTVRAPGAAKRPEAGAGVRRATA
ncbi:MAG: LacI family DNA-binding transcriptional regulator [Verrucomicrobia bacterium]|nr:LacI family DNA-binding transcriptional regulator [Verrucomicrobiota bacterium]